MQILILDAPAVDHLGLGRVGEIDDVGAFGAFITIDHPSDIGVRAVEFLLQLHVGHAQTRPQRDVAEHVDVIAARLLRCPLRGGVLRREGKTKQ